MELDQGKLWRQLGALDLRLVSISACITDHVGHLTRVDQINEKILALLNGPSAYWIEFLVVAEDQDDIAPGFQKSNNRLNIVRAATLSDAVNFIYEKHGARQKLRELARDEFQYIKLIGINSLETPAQHFYQRLPLLLPITQTDLGQGVVSFSDPGYARLKHTGAWDELGDQDDPVCKLVSLEELISTSEKKDGTAPRLVLLGQTGSGKSVFLRYAAKMVAEENLKHEGRALLPVRLDLRDLEIWVKNNQEDARGGLPVYLAKKVHSVVCPSVDIWQMWLSAGDIFLLVDGLQSIQDPVNLLGYFQSAVGAYPDCPILVSCRTASFEQYIEYFEDFIQVYLHSMNEDQQLSFIRAYFNFEDVQPARLFLDHIRQIPGINQAAENPRLLSILCLSVRRGLHGEVASQFPRRQAEIFDSVLDNLLKTLPTFPQGGDRWTGLFGDADGKRKILERLAFDLQLKGVQSGFPLPVEWINDSLRRGLEEERLCESDVLGDVSRALIKDLERNSGLLLRTKEKKTPFRFLHRSIQQHLIACRLAYLLERDGLPDWDRPILFLPEIELSPRVLIDRFSWHSGHQEILLFLAGCLKKPFPLLEMLANTNQDDLFMHRRTLAARCLLEVDLDGNPGIISLRDQLAADILNLWFESTQIIEEEYFCKAVLALGKINVKYQDQLFDSFLANRLQTPPSLGAQTRLIQTLELFRGQPISPILTHCIGEMLQAAIPSVNDALDAVSALGSSAAKPEILQPLCNLLLESPNRSLKAMRALRDIGREAAQPDVIGRMVNLLSGKKIFDDNPGEVRYVILETIRCLGIGQHPDILPILLRVLTDNKHFAEFDRSQAASVLAETDMSTMDFDNLGVVLQEISEIIINSADERVREMGKIAASRAFQNTRESSIRDLMLHWFKQYNLKSQAKTARRPFVAYSYATFFEMQQRSNIKGIFDNDDFLHYMKSLDREELGKAANDPRVVENLLKWMRSNNEAIQDAALEIFHLIVPASPSVWVAEKVADLYCFGDVGSRWRAAEVLGLYGPIAARPDILKAFLFRLKLLTEDQRVIQKTAQALSSMGADVVTNPGFVDAISGRLCDPKGSDTEETLHELTSTLVSMVGTAVQGSLTADQLENSFNALIRRIKISTKIQLTEQISALHHHGLRFFAQKGVFMVKTVEDLCNIS